jgi:GAF domain-containing protein
MADLIVTSEKPAIYDSLREPLRGLLAGEPDPIANAANFAALLFHNLPQVSWVGFYFLKGGELVLGPFQGKPACTRIAIGRGVCGTAAAERRALVVPDVHQFPGHIACDEQSKSEIVVPIVKDGSLVAVLDLDSPNLAGFDAEDQAGLETLVREFVGVTDL